MSINDEIKISIIMPVYNAAKYLDESIGSILNQTMGDFELICIDDGSTDDSCAIIQRYATDSRIRLIKQENQGAGVARNNGIRNVKGRYFLCLDADDIFEPDLCEKVFNRAEATNADLVLFDADMYNEATGKLVAVDWWLSKQFLPRLEVFNKDDVADSLFSLVPGGPCNKLYRTDFIIENDIFFPAMRSVEDVPFVYLAMAMAERISVCESVLAHFRRKAEITGLASQVNYHPERIFESFRVLKSRLVERGLYSSLECAFINKAASDFVDQFLYIIKNEHVSEYYKAYLARVASYEFDLRNKSKRFFTREFVYNKLNEVLTADDKRFSGIKSSNTPKVSVIVPVYNVESYIWQCLNSILSQSLTDFELICVDDGSTDNSLNILKLYEEIDPRIKVMNQNNKFAGAARNLGMSIAKGEFLIFLDSDDFFEKTLLEDLYSSAKKNRADIVLCDGYYFNNITHESTPAKYLLQRYNIPNKNPFSYIDIPDKILHISIDCPWNKLYRREFIESHSLTFQQLRSANDVFFVDTAFVLADRISVVDKKLINYRTNIKTSLQANRSKEPLNFYQALSAVRERIKPTDRYDKVKRSLVHLFVAACKYHLDNAKNEEEFYTLYRFYNSTAFVEWEMTSLSPELFLSNDDKKWVERVLKTESESYYATLMEAKAKAAEKADNESSAKAAEPENTSIYYKLLAEQYRNEVTLIHKSLSFKIGRFITWLPRMIRGFFKCLAENGFKYTAKRVFYHITPGPIYRFFGKVYRKIKGFFMCLKEHGVKYTFDRVLVALRLKKDPYAPTEPAALPNNSPKIPTPSIPLGCSNVPHSPALIVSLTSFPARIGTVHKTIETILRQTERPDKIILWLAEEQFPDKEAGLPNELLELKKYGLEINWCNDIRSYKKLIPALKLYPDDIIVTADDDVYYHTEWLSALYTSYQKWPNYIHCHRITKFYPDGDSFKWVPECLEVYPCPSYLHKLVGVGGVLYPPHSLHSDVTNEELFQKLARTNDDIWFWCMAILNNYKVLVVPNNVSVPKTVGGTQEEALYKQNDKGPMLFISDFNRVVSHYPEIREKLLKDYDFVTDYAACAKIPRGEKGYDYYNRLNPRHYEANLAEWFHVRTGLWLNFDNPLTYNEKIQWLKLYDATELKTRLVDKYLVREWVKEEIGEEHLVPLLGVWDNFDDIDFDTLPSQFVLKTNHGSGSVYIVKDKSKLDINDARSKFASWMSKNFAFGFGFELQYLNVPPKIIAEEYLEEFDQVYDYKFVCFGGECKFIWVDTDRFTGHKRTLFTTDWQIMDESIIHPKSDRVLPKPKCLSEMLEYAEKMSRDFAHARVDFYEVNGHVYFGEMTFTSSSGTENPTPASFGIQMGNWLTLPEKQPLPERKF